MKKSEKTRKAAKKMARYLFTDGSGKRAKRLVMEFETPIPNSIGWSELALVDRIADLLK